MRYLIVFALLCACDMPSPGFRGLEATRVHVEGSTFEVRIKDREAEAIRTNTQYAPRMGLIGERATIAMEQVSGCEVTKISGDAALIHGRLKCGRNPVPVAQERGFPRHAELECYGIDSHISPATDERITNYDCDLYTQ